MRCLLVMDPTGNVVLADLDSGARVPVGEPIDPAEEARATAAVWSAEGEWTAWSIDADRPGGVHELRLHDEVSDTMHVLARSLTAFYLCPSPCGRYLSHLSPGPLGLELAVSDISTGELRIMERGQPLFWAWAPDSSRLAVHVENRVVITPIDGAAPLVLTEDAGPFVAPWWMAGGSVALVAGGRIVSAGPEGSISTLCERAGSGRFVPDRDGRRLAMMEGDGETPSLVVLDLLTGHVEAVTHEPTACFFWSPDGRRLAALTVASAQEVQWVVFDGNRRDRLPPFRPGRTWLTTVLPFFEQYAHSHAVWSADSRSLVASGLGGDGAPEALVHHADHPYDVERLPDAEMAWWALD